MLFELIQPLGTGCDEVPGSAEVTYGFPQRWYCYLITLRGKFTETEKSKIANQRAYKAQRLGISIILMF